MKATILIVDDEPDNLKVVGDYLSQSDPEFKIMQAKNGQIALRIAEKEKPDLILTDWNMPVMTGLELAKAIKSSDDLKHIPVIMQTANTESKQLKEAFESGVMDYIKKPIQELELLARVKSAIELSQAKRKTEELLLSIFPKDVADELKETGDTKAKYYDHTSVLFADIKGFSAKAKKVNPTQLIEELNYYFKAFDDISIKYGLERIKTIGDCYMMVGGLPKPNKTHPVDIVLAALEMQKFMTDQREKLGEGSWEVRLGIHTGDLIAGVIGKIKFAYDVWGSTVNLASRMESTGQVGKVQITDTTFDLIRDIFEVEKVSELVEAKNIGKIQTYFVERIKPEYSSDSEGQFSNEALKEHLIKNFQ